MVELRVAEGQDGAMARRFRSLTAEATEELGRVLGELAWGGLVLTLDGDLGAGKTTFVRGFARGLGIEDGVASPTYTLMQQHDGGRLPLFHFDAWMEGREKALLADGADEFLGDDGVSVVEWAGRIEGWLPSPRLAIQLRHDTPQTRWVSLSRTGEATPSSAQGVVSGGAEGPHGGLGARIDALIEALRPSDELIEEAAGGGAARVSEEGGEPGSLPGVEGP